MMFASFFAQQEHYASAHAEQLFRPPDLGRCDQFDSLMIIKMQGFRLFFLRAA